MDQLTQSQTLAVTPPSLPKGGGTLQGLGETLGQPDSQGNASFSLPLPVSAGRGYSPTLNLSYSSSSGNGHFGTGWQVNVMRITRRTNRGVPGYQDNDEFIGLDGEVLVVARNDQNQPEQRQSHTLQGIDLGETFTVTRYLPRIVSTPARIEYWQPQAPDSTQGAFWLCYSPDGQIHLLGKTPAGRISGPAGVVQIAEWLLEESVSPTGEHLCYRWRGEDDSNCSTDELAYHPDARAERYLSAVYYGNVTASQTLLLLSEAFRQTDWLFTLLFDYGERTDHLHEIPEFNSNTPWPVRQDCFSRYQYGFEIRTRRLCQQVLMFHRLDLLTGAEVTDAVPGLISRLILGYDHHESRTQLVHCRLCAHEADGTACSLPPLEMRYSQIPVSLTADWQPMETLNTFGTDLRWQWVDLQGEGMPGLLYQQGNAWQYRAPQRKAGSDTDVIDYATPVLLPQLPALHGQASLMDMNGDGRLEWVVTAPGLQGYYCSQPDGSWTEFTPLAALPAEFFHPRAMLADLMGAGLPDVALIGPQSVRLYANRRQGFAPSTEAHRAQADSLPLQNADARTLVAFSDVLGSGQQHLVQVRHDGVICWPCLGKGYFAVPLNIPGFSQPAEQFSPERVWLADTDGSGTADLIYATSASLLIYRNLSGNRFAPALELLLPAGVCFDNSCQLAVVDTRGQGGVDLILTVPHMTPRHWRCILLPENSGLLREINNNMGTATLLHYRSSVQFWLDEKARAAENGMTAVSHLPFAFPLLWESEIFDEITGNRVVSVVRYRHGWYDGRERELRGFSCTDLQNTHQRASGNAAEQSPPALLRTWYHQGDPDKASALSAEFWSQDRQAMTLQPHRFTRFTDNGDDVLTTENQDNWWLWRALKGRVLRTELYGLDASTQAEIPYAVMDYRYQVRLIQPGVENAAPIAMLLQLEQLDSQYERIPDDPRISHQLLLAADSLGFPLRTINATWPRRVSASKEGYPDDLPADALESSYDEQQQRLHLSEKQQNWYHLVSQEAWRPGLPFQSRSDVFTYDATDPAIALPAVLCVEILLQEEGLLKDGPARTFAGQTQVYYTESDPQTPLERPNHQALIAFTETALLDAAVLAAMAEIEINDQQLQEAGYNRADFLFPRADEGKTESLWSGRLGYT